RRDRRDDAELGDATEQDEQADDDADEEQPAHRRRAGLHEVGLGAFNADPLAHPDELQEPDVGRHEDHDDREREEEALDELDPHRPPRGSGTGRASTTWPSSIPRDAFTSATSPSRSRRPSTSRAASRSRVSTIRDGSSPAARAPAAIPAAPFPTVTS